MNRIDKMLSQKPIPVSSDDDMDRFVNRELNPVVQEVRARWNGFVQESVGEARLFSGMVPPGYLAADGATYAASAWPELWANYKAASFPYGGSAGDFAVPSLASPAVGCDWYVFAGKGG